LAGNTRFIYQLPKVQQVGTTSAKFADAFSTTAAAGAATIAALDADAWDIYANTGMTPTLTGGSLTVATGTAAGNELLLVGRSLQTIPANLMAAFMMSARVNGQFFRFGYVEVDPTTGDPLPHASTAGLYQNLVCATFDGTTANGAKLEAVADDCPLKTQSVPGMVSTASACEYSLEARNEDVTMVAAVADSAAVRSSNAGRLSTVVPNPSRAYRPFLWFKNTAATTNTTITVYRIAAVDVQELQAEVGGGRGNTTASQSMPMFLTGVNGNLNVALVATTANAQGNGLSVTKVFSTASTNATNLKTSLCRLCGGQLVNTGNAVCYVKFYNKNSAPTVGTDVPLAILTLPPNEPVALGSVFDQWGLGFPNGFSYALTGGAADADTTAVAAGQVIGFLQYI
jgi:hypothetical protein